MKYVLTQFVKFMIVGGLAFVIDYGLLVLLTDVFNINYLISGTISFTVSAVFNYILSMHYIYVHKPGYSRKKEFIIFIILSICGLIINNLILYVSVDIFNYDYRFMKLFSAVVVSLWNFISRKIWLDQSGMTKEDENDIDIFE